MRKKGDKGAPTEANFARAAETAKNAMYGGKMKRNMKGGGKAGLKALAKERPDVVKDMGFDPMNLGKGGNVCKTRKKMSYGGKMKNYSSEGKKYGGSANMPNPRKPMGTM